MRHLKSCLCPQCRGGVKQKDNVAMEFIQRGEYQTVRIDTVQGANRLWVGWRREYTEPDPNIQQHSEVKFSISISLISSAKYFILAAASCQLDTWTSRFG